MTSSDVKNLSDQCAFDLAEFVRSHQLEKEVAEKMANNMEENWAYFDRPRFMKLCGF